jgi:5-(carboxyamino)imidazole ribonucleotide mutase
MTHVAVFIGSASDEAVIAPCAQMLRDLKIPYVFTITSAHRTPERTEALVRRLEEDGCRVFICAAGMAAHLAGAVAARTLRPVIGIPLSAPGLGGMDALLSTVQMPPGVPVAAVGLDTSGAKNAALLAARILALDDADLAMRLERMREKDNAAITRAGEELAGRHGAES